LSKKYGKPTNIKKELKAFYKEISKYSINKIICLDETSIQPAMYLPYEKCDLGKRCVVKTDDNNVIDKVIKKNILKIILSIYTCKWLYK